MATSTETLNAYNKMLILFRTLLVIIVAISYIFTDLESLSGVRNGIFIYLAVRLLILIAFRKWPAGINGNEKFKTQLLISAILCLAAMLALFGGDALRRVFPTLVGAFVFFLERAIAIYTSNSTGRTNK